MELKDEINHQINHVNETKDQHEQMLYEDIPNDYATIKKFFSFKTNKKKSY